MPLPPLLSSRPPAMQILIANVIPCVFGAFTGLMLGVNAIVYLVLAVPIAILGGYVAGLEHPNGREGAVRGFVGGLQFGAFILVVDALSGLDRKTDLPKPAILLLLLTTIGGTILGFLGGRARERRMRQAA